MNNPLSTDASQAVDSAAQAADRAIRGSQRVTQHAFDQLADGVESARASVGPALDGMANDSAELARRGTEAVSDAARHVRDQAVQLRQTTRSYIEQQPLQAMLIAMAAGAALVLLGSLLSRGRSDGQ